MVLYPNKLPESERVCSGICTFALSVHIPDVSTSIYVEVDSKVLLGLPFCDKAFVR